MTRLVSALRLELTLQVRQKFLHAAIFSGLIWLAVLLPMPARLRPIAEPYVLVGDVAIIGFFFVGGTVFFEKQERTIGAIISTPLRFWECLAAKLALLVAISLRRPTRAEQREHLIVAGTINSNLRFRQAVSETRHIIQPGVLTPGHRPADDDRR
jgi:hypothetical protein